MKKIIVTESQLKTLVNNVTKKMINEGYMNEEEFVCHGYYTVSNSGGYEIMLSNSNDAAKIKDPKSGEISDWLEIEYVPSEDGESEPVIDPNGYDIPLNMVMRANR